MITVDNDSQDKTPDIIKDYVPKFNEKGYSLKYIHQDDLGPSAGIQTGLRLIKGEYLSMPDSDDYYSDSTSIETFVHKFLSLPKEYAIIRSQIVFVNEKDLQPTGITYKDFPEDDPGTLFEDCLYGKNGYNYAPIGYMVKVSALRETTGLEIHHSYYSGQQLQICLPLYYNYKAWTIPKPLGCFLVREKSVSHSEYSKYPVRVKMYQGAKHHINSILDSITAMPTKEKEEYLIGYLKMSSQSIAFLAMETRHFRDAEKFLSDYKKYGGIPWRVRFVFMKRFLRQIIMRIKGNK